MPTEPILRVEQVHYTYAANSPRPIHALQGVSFDIHSGEYVAIIGHNGSGKSTLAKHLNGLLVPSQGNIWVKEWNTKDAAHRLAIRSTVGMVFQTPDNQIIATLVEEDVAFGPENLGVPRTELRARVDWALDTVEMQAFRHRAPHLLSGGQKQRVAIAGILAMQPQVLVLDESTALLDPLGREEVLGVARRLNDQGVTIVAITHFMHEAALADRVIVMKEGQIALEGTPRQVFAQVERLRALQLDVPEITRLAHLVHAKDDGFPQVVLTVPEFVDAVKERVKVPSSGNGHTASLAIPAAPDELVRDANRPGEIVVSVTGLEHTYLRGTPLESAALRGVDLDIRRGEIVGIIGHTGSGKSTLVQHLNGLVRPQVGEVHVLDYDLRNPKIDTRGLRRRVGLVFQFPEAQLFEQHVGDDVAFGPWQMGMRGEELRTRVREAMDAVGLPFDLFKDRPLYALSGGERRRAALAGVLAIKPEILVLDEPTAGLDPRGHQDILARIMALQREWGTTLVIISHNMEEIARLCDRVYVLSGGRTVLSGAPRTVFAERSRLESLGLGVPQVAVAMQELREQGVIQRGNALSIEEAEQELQRVLNGRL